MKFLTATLALFSAIPLVLGFTEDPSVEFQPATEIFARQTFYEKHFCYPVEAVPNLRPGKTSDVNKLIEVVKRETNDILMIKQTCAVYTCYNNIGIYLCNFDGKDITITPEQLAAEITEVSVNCDDIGLTAGVKSSKKGYNVSVGAISSIKPGWSCS